MSTIRFRGAGINAAGIFTAVNNANDGLSKKTFPAGITWPFVSLSIGDKSVEFKMAQIHKVAAISDITKVSLNKVGYLLFYTRNGANDFGFTTSKLDALIKELSRRGYPLDESVIRNRGIAKFFIVLQVVVFLLVFGVVTTLGILRPNGL